MSLEAMQRIISRATTDQEFRQAMVDDPDGVCTDRDVTPQEIAALKGMDWGAVGSLGGDVEVRGYLLQAGMPRILAACK
ncbi:MAG: Os1348 family NHLP clan protein [Dehalococcoidia bacterium]